MNDIKNKIISFLRRNRVSTTEVADCLGKSGVIPNIFPVVPGMYVAGEIKYVYAHSESNWSVHEQIQTVPPDTVVLIDAVNVNDRAVAGELIVKYLHLYCQAVAVVTIGKMRDANDLIRNRYPVWCNGYSPVGCFNTLVQENDEVRRATTIGRKKYDGAIAVCDDSGVVTIPKESFSEEFYEQLEHIEKQEDIWFHCIDSNKWTTFDTVCLKKYLTEK